MVSAVGLVCAAVMLTAWPGARPTAQQPGIVRGRIRIGVPVTAPRPTSAYSRSISPAELAPVSELRQVVVYLEGPPVAQSLPAAHPEIRQRNENFVPRVVAVPVGSDVVFPNDDPFYHNVFSLSRAKTFNLGRYPQGTSRHVHFDKPGIVKVFCEIHSHMTATVMVFDHPWFAVPDEDGRFELPAMPAGQRHITAWHDRLGDTTINVQVEAGRAATADFTLPIPRQ